MFISTAFITLRSYGSYDVQSLRRLFNRSSRSALASAMGACGSAFFAPATDKLPPVLGRSETGTRRWCNERKEGDRKTKGGLEYKLLTWEFVGQSETQLVQHLGYDGVAVQVTQRRWSGEKKKNHITHWLNYTSEESEIRHCNQLEVLKREKRSWLHQFQYIKRKHEKQTSFVKISHSYLLRQTYEDTEVTMVFTNTQRFDQPVVDPPQTGVFSDKTAETHWRWRTLLIMRHTGGGSSLSFWE